MSHSHRNAVLAALLVGIIVMLPACGGSSSDSNASAADTEAGADGAADGSASDAGAGGQSFTDRCQELAARWQDLIAGQAAAVGGGVGDAATIRSQIEALDGEFPEPVAAAFATFAITTEKVLDLMGDVDDGAQQQGAAGGALIEPTTTDLDARLTQVAEVSTSAEFTVALAQIDAYFASTCPPA